MKSRSPRNSSEEQRISILRKAFDVYDVDGSGAIDYEEFKRLLQDLGWPSHEEFLHRAVRVLDQDMSGEIEFTEFLKWTKFAYASRILYRHEMYGVGPRYTSNDDANFPSLVGSEDDQIQNRKRGIMVRRASLTTVFEGKEDGDQDVPRTAMRHPSQAGASSDEEASGTDRGPDLVLQTSESSQYSDNDNAQTGTRRFSGSRDRDGSNNNSTRTIRFRSQNSFQEQMRDENPNSDDRGSIVSKEEAVRADEDGTNAREFSTPVREMAAMLLSPGRRGMRVHTSRSRSKSIGILNDRPRDRHEGKFWANRESLTTKLGPRTESKMTVRMRWVCGQFGNADVGDDKQSLSASSSRGMEMCKNQAEGNSGYEADKAQRRNSGCEESGNKTLSRVVSQEVGVDLRRVRSE